MNSCYADTVVFSDPVFQNLEGWKAKAMWSMLCERAQDFSLEFSGVTADDKTGKAHWEPKYTFSKNGNRIHNFIDASFEFENGKIVKHTDKFDLYRWARMALGTAGIFMGWLPSVQNKVRAEANTGLEMFIKRKKLAPK